MNYSPVGYKIYSNITELWPGKLPGIQEFEHYKWEGCQALEYIV